VRWVYDLVSPAVEYFSDKCVCVCVCVCSKDCTKDMYVYLLLNEIDIVDIRNK